jgi:hypothetical protein
MWFTLLSYVRSSARAGQISEPRRRQRRAEHDPNAPPEAPNPDFDFGPLPSPVDLTAPTTSERIVSRVVVFILLLTLIPSVLAAALLLFL